MQNQSFSSDSPQIDYLKYATNLFKVVDIEPFIQKAASIRSYHNPKDLRMEEGS